MNKDRIRGWIASTNGNPVSALIASGAEKFLNAYRNYSNWSMELNGELRALRLVIDGVQGDVFDVGANTGQWANTMLPFLASKTLHSFEPVPPVYEKLIQAVPASRHVKLNNFGLSDQQGMVDINYSASSSTISSAYPLIYGFPDTSTLSCQFTTGDAYMAKSGVDEIALLKVDVEGMELAVLNGFAEAFQRGKIAAVQFEHGPSHVLSGHTMKTFVDYFTALGFDIYSIFPNKLKALEYSLDQENFTGQNLLAVRKDVTNALSL